MKMKIILRNGVTVEGDVTDDWNVKTIDNELREVRWPWPDGSTEGIAYVRLDEIVAITILH